jgi:hypothetical protein
MRNALRNGTACAITVGIAYAACTAVFWLFPDAAAAFMNGLFHGLDFRKLQAGASAFSFGGFAYALTGLVVWAFTLGSLFAALLKRV